jgi:uncharacterized protein
MGPPMNFYVYRDRAGEIRWTLYAGNGEPLADSGEGYKRKADCLHAINLIAGGVGGIPIRYAAGFRE